MGTIPQSMKSKKYMQKLKDSIIKSDNRIYKQKKYNTLIKYLNNNMGIKDKVYKNNISIDYKISNKKLSGKDTIIFSISTALLCESAIKGTCQLYKNKVCYALRNDLQYNTSVLYKNRQSNQWHNLKAWQLAINFIRIKKIHPSIKLLRLNESGDVKKSDMLKLNIISDILKKYGIRVYTYTHNRDIENADITSDNLTINSSHKDKKLNNRFLSFSKEKINRIMKYKKDKKIIHCIADCSKCKACTKSNDLTILCTLH